MKLDTIVLAPDSFKGTMSAEEVCDVWARAIARRLPQAQVRRVPLADGGEGLVEAALHILKGSLRQAQVLGPFGEPLKVDYALLPDGQAVVEMACCAGLPLVGSRQDPFRASTWGVGQLLAAVRDQGASGVLLGLGGSATNDGGMGMAAALGYQFLDEHGRPLEPLALNLHAVRGIRPPEKSLGIPVVAACDVDNPLTGPQGASHVFGAQKGAGEDGRVWLDEGLENLARVMERDLGQAVSHVPGAGAAGGLGAGVLAFLGGKLRPGIELLLDAAHFDQLLEDADLVLTGEGRMDGQTVHGKTPCGVAGRARKMGVPCIALCGSAGDGVEAVYGAGIDAVFCAVRGACSFEQIRKSCKQDMEMLTDAVLRTLMLGGQGR